MHMFLKLTKEICVVWFFFANPLLCLLKKFMVTKINVGSIYSKYKTHVMDFKTIKAPGEYALVRLIFLHDFRNFQN